MFYAVFMAGKKREVWYNMGTKKKKETIGSGALLFTIL
jgi:hypothetical protein